MNNQYAIMDGNEAAAYIAYNTNEVIAIYPITPASPMGEWADQWSAHGRPNIWGQIPKVQEMQAEGGAAGAVHGALQGGALTTTFTASQGLLLMIPNMYKIAGELTATVFHIAARSVACQALSIFGDHSDVMAARATGFAMLFSSSVQEVMDQALIAQAATLRSRVPFLHIFDGFRTSHELNRVVVVSKRIMREMLDSEMIEAHRRRGLSPDRPVVRGTAQNPDVFFQAREAVNPYYNRLPALVQREMDRFAELTGRRYKIVDYFGHPEATEVIVLMGSGCETVKETVSVLNERGGKVGCLQVRLYRPFPSSALVELLPDSVRCVGVLDRTKEPGAPGEPLYLDVAAALDRLRPGKVQVVGGRYGLSSKEFTPAMVAGVFKELAQEKPKHSFTVGIIDDVTGTHVEFDPEFITESKDTVRAVFWGLGSDGTVSANKNSIKIIGEEQWAQGYFVYDSKKAGARTVSHLRFGPKPINSPYLIQRASFVAVHQFEFLRRFPVLDNIEAGGTFLLNSPYPKEDTWSKIPRKVQKIIKDKHLKVFGVDAYKVARDVGLKVRINTVMQTCFFAVSGVLPKEIAIEKIKKAVEKTYGNRGPAVVRRNFQAIDRALEHLYEIEYSDLPLNGPEVPPLIPEEAPEFVKQVTAEIIAERGDLLPVSKLPADGTYPSATSRWEKRNLSLEVPLWEEELCIQCGKCVLVCPHAVIRAKAYDPSYLQEAPAGFKSAPCRWKEMRDKRFTIQVSVEDCTGCRLCVEICPAKDRSKVGRKALNMVSQLPIREQERNNWKYFLELPDLPGVDLGFHSVKDVQLLQPRFEFSGACAGCGETPYLKLMSQLFGDRAVVANATGCSSIYGGNLPTTPWSVDKNGRGPAWNNSLFEDNAEFGLGIRLALDQQRSYVELLLRKLQDLIGVELVEKLLAGGSVEEIREYVAAVKKRVRDHSLPEVKDLLSLIDSLVPRSVWIVGGDGWAYDIGYGGLDHVLASGLNVNVLVMDTEVYSNTGGQASKATPLGAVAKFAAGGKATPKKDLGMLAMSYGDVYVAQVAMGASDTQTVKAFLEAESYPGTSLIVAYCHCIAHGIDMSQGMNQQKLAVKSGQWPLYRFDPRRVSEGKRPLQLDYKGPQIPLKDYLAGEGRFRILQQAEPELAAQFERKAQELVNERWRKYRELAGLVEVEA